MPTNSTQPKRKNEDVIVLNIAPELISSDYEREIAKQEEEDVADLIDILLLLPLLSAMETNLERPPHIKNTRLHKNILPVPLTFPFSIPQSKPRIVNAITESPIITATPHAKA